MRRKFEAYIVNCSTPNSEYKDHTRHFATEEEARRFIERIPEDWKVMRFFKRTYTIADEDFYHAK